MTEYLMQILVNQIQEVGGGGPNHSTMDNIRVPKKESKKKVTENIEYIDNTSEGESHKYLS